MGKQKKIKTLQRELRHELSKINKDLTVKEKEQLFIVARRKLLNEYIYDKPRKELSS